MTTMHAPVDNGVNVEALLGVRDALPNTPEIAQFQWRTTVSWVNGTHSRSSVDTFYGFGEEQHHKTTFTYDADHPLAFAAQDNGITPVEYVLVAPGQLPHRRHRVDRPAAKDSTAFGAGDPGGR